MIDPIMNNLGAITAQSQVTRRSAAGEFTKIFYKELFRQAFTSQFQGESSVLGLTNQEVLLDKLAEDFARKNAGILR